MSRKPPKTIEDMDADDRRIAQREADLAEIRMEGAVSRRELLDAIDRAAEACAADCFETSRFIASALRSLASELR